MPYQHFSPFVPAKAGTQGQVLECLKVWVPASAGTNGECRYSALIPVSLIMPAQASIELLKKAGASAISTAWGS
jgi:hypothetical protein